MFISKSPPYVVKGDSGHEQGDGEVTSIPFPANNQRKGEEGGESSDMTVYNIFNSNISGNNVCYNNGPGFNW